MPFLRIGAALTGGVARAAARLRNNRHDPAKQDDLFFPEDEPAESAFISEPPGPKCLFGRERELANPPELAQSSLGHPEEALGAAQAVQPLVQPELHSFNEAFVQAVASSSCDDTAGHSDFCSVGSFEARRRAVSVKKVRDWDVDCAMEPSTPGPEPEPEPELSGLPGSRDSSLGGAEPELTAVAPLVVPTGGAAAQLAQPTHLAFSTAAPAAGDVSGSSGSSGGDTAASGASVGQVLSSSSSGSPSSSIKVPDPVVANTAAATGCKDAIEASNAEAGSSKSPFSKPAPGPAPATAAAAMAACVPASSAPASASPVSADGRGAGGAAGCSRLAAVGFGDVVGAGAEPQAAVAAALGGRAPVHVGYSAPHVVKAAAAASSRAVVATAAAMARPHPAALPAVPPLMILRDANDVPLPAAQQLAARAASMASRGSSARHSLDVAAASAGATAADISAAAVAGADVAVEAVVVDSPLPPSILETRPPDVSSLVAIRKQVEVLRLMHLQRQAAALLAAPAAGRGSAVGSTAGMRAGVPAAGAPGGTASDTRTTRPLDLASAAAAAVAEVRAAMAAAEAAASAGSGAAADGRSSSGSAPFTASSQQTSASQVPFSASPPSSPVMSTPSVTALAGSSPPPSLPASPLRPSANGSGHGRGHTRHFSIDASPPHSSPMQLLQQADPGKAATGVGYSVAPAQSSAAGAASPRPSPLQPQYNATVGGGSTAAAASAMGGLSALSLSAPLPLAPSSVAGPAAAARAASPPPRSPLSVSSIGMSPAVSPADIQRQQAQLKGQIEALQRQIALKQQAARTPTVSAQPPSPPASYSQQQQQQQQWQQQWQQQMMNPMMQMMPMMPMMPMMTPQQAWPADAAQATMARTCMPTQQQLGFSGHMPAPCGQHPNSGAAAAGGSGLGGSPFSTAAMGDGDVAAEGGGGEGELLSSHPSFRQHLHDPVPVAEAARRTQDWLASTAVGAQDGVPPPPANGGHDPSISPNGGAYGGIKSALKRDPSLRLSPHPAAYSPPPSAAAQPWQQQQQQQQQQAPQEQQQPPSRSPSPPPAISRAPSTRYTRFADEPNSPNSRSPSPSPLARSASQRRNSTGAGGEESSPSGTGASTSQSGMARAPSFNRTPSLSRTPSLMRSSSRRGPVPPELLDASNGPVPLWRIASFNRQLSVAQPSMVRRQRSITSQNSGGAGGGGDDGGTSSHRSSSRRQRESSKSKARREAAALQAKMANGPPPSPLALMSARMLQEAGDKLQPAPRLPTGRAFFVPLRPDLRLDIYEHENTASTASGMSLPDSRDL